MLDRVRTFYFSGAHLIRDAIGTIAPLTAVLIAIIGTNPALRAATAKFYHDVLSTSTFWAFVLILVGYSLFAYAVGFVANFAGNAIHRLWQRAPIVGRKSSYTYWYGKNKDEINELYRETFPRTKTSLSSGAAVPLTDQINVLKEYLRPTNPTGFSAAYRQFMKVDIVRSLLFYSLCLMFWYGYQLYESNSAEGEIGLSVCAVIVWVSLAELPRRVRKVVRTEYQFIMATIRMKQDIESGLLSAGEARE